MRTLLLLLIAATVIPALGQELPTKEEPAAKTNPVEKPEITPLRVPFSETADLVFQQPKSFQFRITRDPDDGFRPALAFNAFGPKFKTQGLKLFVLDPAQKGEFEKLEQLEERLKRVAGRYAAESVEQEVKPRPLKMAAKEDLGCYATLTDASLKDEENLAPGQFRCMTFGFARVGDVLLQIRMYSNSSDDADFKAALTMIEGMSVGKAEAPRPPKKGESAPSGK